MSNANKVRSEQLGMPYGTAYAQLRKNLIYSLAKKCEMNTCYRCGTLIDSIDDFTIDHKVEWLHSQDPLGLFLDIDNIAFSHALCNYNERRTFNVTKSKSGFKGVHHDPRRKSKPWDSCITVNGKSKRLGSFATPQEAAKVYDEAAEQFFGDKAVTNKSLGLI